MILISMYRCIFGRYSLDVRFSFAGGVDDGKYKILNMLMIMLY